MMGRQQLFSKDDIEFIKNNYQFMTCAEISNVLGFTTSQVKGKVDKLHLPRKKRKINDDYFKNIDTPLKAYLLGFIYADGWIVNNEARGNYEFGMELQSQDKYILEKINDELGGQNIIYHSNDDDIFIFNDRLVHKGHSDTLRVYSKKIVNDLIKHGVVTNKSKKDIFPVVDDNVFFDFLRGYIDGDGCYYVNNGHTYMHITCASIVPLRYLQDKLKSFCIETHIYSENSTKHRLMCINTQEMQKLVNCLYYSNDVFCLIRKYDKIKHFLGLAS